MFDYAVVDSFARSAAVLAIAWMSMPGVADKSTPTPTPAPTQTPSQTPTQTPTPTPASATLTSPVRVVAMTIADAKATVWAGIAAAPEPRIEGAIVVDRERLVNGWPVAASFLQRDPSAWKDPERPPLLQYERGTSSMMQPRDSWMLPAADAASFNLPPTKVETMIIVRGSVGVISYQLTGSGRGEGGDVAPGQRENFEVYFDAATGREVYADGYAPDSSGSLLQAFAYATSPAFVTRTPDPSASPEHDDCRWHSTARSGTAETDLVTLSNLPADALDPVRLAPGRVPRALVGIADGLGLVPGSRRRYRSTSTGRPSDWSGGGTLTEAIDVAWQIAPDVILIRTTWSAIEQRPGCSGNRLEPGVDWRYVFPHAVVGGVRSNAGDEARFAPIADARWLVDQRKEWTKGDLELQRRWPWLPDQELGWMTDYDVRGGAIEDVTVPAGRFKSCRGLVEENNVGTAISWYCPAVGPARVDGVGGNPPAWSSRQLLWWYVPPIVPFGPLPTATVHTPTPRPPTSTPTPTVTPIGTLTPTPTRYPTDVPMPTPAPHIVALTLEDARASVRKRMAAAPGLRVGEAAYVSRHDLFGWWPYEAPSPGDNAPYLSIDIVGDLRAIPTPTPISDALPLATPRATTTEVGGGMLIVVEGSIGDWPRWPAKLAHDRGLELPPFGLTTLGCFAVEDVPREPFHVVLDALTGRWAGVSWLSTPWQTCLLRSLAAGKPDAFMTATPSRVAPRPRELATPLPPRAVATTTRTPSAPALPEPPRDAWRPRPLGRGQVPRALAGIASDLPLAMGARWSFSVRSEDGPTFTWEQHAFTETVDAAWQIAPDVMLSHVTSTSGSPMWGHEWLYTFPNGVATELHKHRGIGRNGEAPLALLRRLFGRIARHDLDLRPLGLDANMLIRYDIHLMPWPELPESGPPVEWHWRPGQRTNAVVPAGRFEGCTALDSCFGTNSALCISVLCPGVGWVQGIFVKNGRALAELVSYDLPPIVARDALPPATSTLRPSRTPTIVPPTRTPSPTTIPPSSPTVTAPPTPLPPPTSYPVSLTLEDARRSVRERMGAAAGLRVGGAAYVTGRDLFERWPYRPGVANAGLTYLDVTHSFDGRSMEPPAVPLADVVVVVEGSIAPRPRSFPADDRPDISPYFVLTESLGCARFDGTPRAPFHAVVDARTGQWLGASWLQEPWQTCMLRDLTTATPPRVIRATPMPTTPASAPTAAPRRPPSWPWPADGPTPRPPDLPDNAWQPRPLARGQVPAALAKIAADLPVAAGSRWRYEWSSMTNYTFYERQDVVTETIDAAWQIGPDVMVSHISTSPGMRVMWGRDGVWLYTFPNGLATNLQVHRGLGPDHKPSLSIMRSWLDKIAIEDGQEASEMAANALNEGVETLAIDALPWPPSVWHYATWAWHWSGDADVRVPAGRFRGCHGLDVAWGSNSGRAYDWFYSGIGLVRHDDHDYGTGYGDNAMELVAYDIPPLVARDAPPLPTTTATPTKTPAARVARRTMSLIRQ